MGRKEPATGRDECEVCGDRVLLTEGVPVGRTPGYVRVCTPVDTASGELVLLCQLLKLRGNEVGLGDERALRAISPGDEEFVEPVLPVPYFMSVVESLGGGLEGNRSILTGCVKRSGDGRLDVGVHRKL